MLYKFTTVNQYLQSLDKNNAIIHRNFFLLLYHSLTGTCMSLEIPLTKHRIVEPKQK